MNKIADTLETQGDNPYRVRAYRRAANSIYLAEINIEQLINHHLPLTQIRFVGEGIAKHIKEIIVNPNFSTANLIKKRTDHELKRVMGLGPKRIKLLRTQYNIQTRKELLTAMKHGKLDNLRGFNQKFQEKLLANLKNLNLSKKRLDIKMLN